MKTAEAVVNRCLCNEIVRQRAGVEEQCAPAEGEDLRQNQLKSLNALGLANDALTSEKAMLETPVGALADSHSTLQLTTVTIVVLLWCLNRTQRFPTVEGFLDESLADDIEAAGFLESFDFDKIKEEVGRATLRPATELEHQLMSVAAAYHQLSTTKPGFFGKKKHTGGIVLYATALRTLAWVLHPQSRFDDPAEMTVAGAVIRL